MKNEQTQNRKPSLTECLTERIVSATEMLKQTKKGSELHTQHKTIVRAALLFGATIGVSIGLLLGIIIF